MSQPSANNAEQFKQSFREEGREVLVDLEAALLELNENAPTWNWWTGLSRLAYHQGLRLHVRFEKLAAFTHNLETAFDQVRNGRLQIGSELIDLTLAALDQIRAMLEEGTGAEPADAAVCAGILAKVRQLAGIPQSQAAGAKASPPPTRRPLRAGQVRECMCAFRRARRCC